MYRIQKFYKILYCFCFLYSLSVEVYSQESIFLNGETPIHLTSIGTGVYSKTVLYNSLSRGFLIDLAKNSDNHSGVPIDFEIESRGGGHNFLFIKGSNGNVGLGTDNPSHRLDVIGTVRAREVKVDMHGADFVFEKHYHLMSLKELENFISLRRHLPGIQPASEMQVSGVSLGEFNTQLLQKIEELTLYLIQQDKRIEELTKEKNSLADLIRRVEALEKD